MEKLRKILLEYNPELLKRIVESDLDKSIINDLFLKKKIGGYLPDDVMQLYTIFNGTLLNYENEQGILRVEANCSFFNGGYLMDIDTAVNEFEKHIKKFNKKGEIYFPVFSAGFDIFYAIVLKKDFTGGVDDKGLFRFIIGKNPIRVYDTFSLFLETLIQAYEDGVYYFNSNNLFSNKSYELFELKKKLNPNSSLSF